MSTKLYFPAGYLCFDFVFIDMLSHVSGRHAHDDKGSPLIVTCFKELSMIRQEVVKSC